MEALPYEEPASTVPRPASAFRPQPTTVEETGLDFSQVVDLTLKTLRKGGRLSGGEVASRLHLPFRVIDTVLKFLKKELLIETVGSAGLVEQQYEYTLSDKGYDKATEALDRNEYVGPAPVPLDEYVAVVNQQSVRNVKVTPAGVSEALTDLELSPAFNRLVGAAVNGGHSILLYGKPGNGKSSVAKRLTGMLGGMVLIPYAIDIGGQTIRVFDPRVHSRIDITPHVEEPSPPPANYQERRPDLRWVPANRPLLMVGGEMSLDDLDLRYSSQSKFYLAPIQMLANGGILVIDDFGRQAMRPDQLLNRWIIPLEDGTDHYSLNSGETIEVPFDLLVVFSTNLRPEDLGDEAFWRRIRHKVEVGDPSDESFLRILQNVCQQNSIPFTHEGWRYLIETHYKSQNRPYRAVHPRDIIGLMMDMAGFEDKHPELTPEWIDAACASYFIETSLNQS